MQYMSDDALTGNKRLAAVGHDRFGKFAQFDISKRKFQWTMDHCALASPLSETTMGMCSAPVDQKIPGIRASISIQTKEIFRLIKSLCGVFGHNFLRKSCHLL